MTTPKKETTARDSRTEPSGLDRRSFFKGAALGLGAGIAATGVNAATGAPATAATTDSDQGHYRLTDHVRRVYALARF